MELTFTENIKDKAARLMSTPFSEIVDEATSELLLSPDYGRIMMLCDSVNQSQKDYNTDVVRAVRRRIDHKIPKVQYFAVVVVEALIKNCGPLMHAELAENRPLQRDLIAIALREPSKDGEGEAKDVAIQLILDCSYWFRKEVSTEKTRALGEMINFVSKARNGQGRGLFEGREADKAAPINRVEAVKAAPQQTPDRNASARSRQQRQGGGGARSRFANQGHFVPGGSDGRRGDGPAVVDAIPIIPPTEEEISGMMDAVMLLVESLNAAEESQSPVSSDEMITAISGEVRAQHRKLSIMISSGAELEAMEVLLSITDSQVAVIQRLSSMLRNQGQVATANRIAEDAGLPAHNEGDAANQHNPQHQFQPSFQQHGGGPKKLCDLVGPERDAAAARFVQFYREHNPSEMQKATKVFDYDMTEDEMMIKLREKYQVPPTWTGAEQQQQQPPPDIETLIDQSRQSQQYGSAPPPPPPPSAATSQQQPAVYQPGPETSYAPTYSPGSTSSPPPPPASQAPAYSAPADDQQYAYQQPSVPYAQNQPQHTPVAVSATSPPYSSQQEHQQHQQFNGNSDNQSAQQPQQQQTRAAPTIDDLFGDSTAPAPVVYVPPPPPPQAAPHDEVWGTQNNHAPSVSTPPPQHQATRSAADIDDVPAPPAHAPPASHAFPSPNQQLDPAKVETKDEDAQEQREPQVVGSLNGGDDEFDAFLNNRLGS